jgi:hypothetical protein
MKPLIGYHQREALLDMLDNHGLWPPHWKRLKPDWAASLLNRKYIEPITVTMHVRVWDTIIDSHEVPTYRITSLGRKRMAE